MKKKKKGPAKKEDKAETSADSTKPEDTPESPGEAGPESSTGNETKGSTEVESRDGEETVQEQSKATHQRQPSLSVQSKMRSSSFRQGPGGPLSPNSFSPDGDTAPEIYRKQAVRIEELEKELKKVSKDAIDGEKRWRKAEEELEKILEEESPTKDKHESSGDLEKLVGF